MIRQASRFGLVGLANTLVDFAVFAALLPRTEPLWANAIAWLTSFGCAFVMNSTFTFRTEMSSKRLAFFFLTSLLTLAVSSGCVGLMTEHLGVWPAKVMAVAISYVLGYTLARTIAFR